MHNTPFIPRRSLLLGAASSLLLTFACKPAAQPESKPGSTAPVAASKVRIGYFANLTHAQAVLGVESGAYAKAMAPAALETKIFNAGPSLIEALNAGEIDIGYVGPGPALNAWVKSKGKGLKIIAGAASNGVLIVVSSKSGITKLEELKGKRIATPQLGNTQDIAAKWYLKNVLKQDNADNVVPIPNAEQLNLLERGQIDAAWAPEPWGTRLINEAGGKLLAAEKDLWPNKEFSLTLVITTPEFFKAHPDQVKSFLAAHATLTSELQSHADTQAAAIAAGMTKLTGKKISAELIAAALANVKFTNDPLVETLKVQAEHSFDLGLYKEAADLKGLVDTSLLPAR